MADGIHLGEAEFLVDIRYLSDSASEMEGCPVETKVITAHPHATPDEASLGPSIKLSALPWRQGDLTQFEQRTLRSLERIETQHSGAAETILNYRWVADSITEEEMQTLASLATMIGRRGGRIPDTPGSRGHLVAGRRDRHQGNAGLKRSGLILGRRHILGKHAGRKSGTGHIRAQDTSHSYVGANLKRLGLQLGAGRTDQS